MDFQNVRSMWVAHLALCLGMATTGQACGGPVTEGELKRVRAYLLREGSDLAELLGFERFRDGVQRLAAGGWDAEDYLTTRALFDKRKGAQATFPKDTAATCLECGASMAGRRAVAKYCSHQCSKTAGNRREQIARSVSK
ncbi:MAG: hypothetical protein ABJM82_16895 [Shimia thalassica]|uniref:hypothetical protein n=1 Tax=Shimia thalassica TaxID=1715693 RepID=UPI00329927E7